MSMAITANEALRRGEGAMKRIEALEERLASALRRINALEDLVWHASADVDEIAVTIGEPSP
jgi:uncharacterized coiled-coil protein SlyX